MKWVLALCVTAAAALASWQLYRITQPAPEYRSENGLGYDPSEVQGIGYAEPASEVRKLMLRTGGVVKRHHFRVGDTVRKGETILELEDGGQRAEVEVARRGLELARAEADDVNAGTNPHRIKAAEGAVERLKEKVRHGRSEVERYRKLVASRAAAPQEHEAVESQLRQVVAELQEQEATLLYLRKVVTPERRAAAAAKIRHAEAALALAEERLREAKLAAPFDGTILKFLKREGEGMSTLIPEPVVLFADVSRMRVRAEVDERFVGRIVKGQRAVVFGRNLAGESYVGRVGEVEPVMGGKTMFTGASSERKDLNVLQVLIDMGPDFQAPAGLQVDAKIEVRAAEVAR